MADALASGASVRKDVGVQVPPRAPTVNLVNRTERHTVRRVVQDKRIKTSYFVRKKPAYKVRRIVSSLELIERD